MVSVGAAPLVGVASTGFVSAGFVSAGFSSFLVLELLPFKMLLNLALRSDNAFGAAFEKKKVSRVSQRCAVLLGKTRSYL